MKKIILFCFCTVLLASVLAQTGTGTASAQPGSDESLYKLAQKLRTDFYLGSFASGLNPSREDNKQLTEFFSNNFNILTAGIYMFGSQREQGKYNLENVDYLVDFATSNNIKVYFHPLFGGLYIPRNGSIREISQKKSWRKS